MPVTPPRISAQEKPDRERININRAGAIVGRSKRICESKNPEAKRLRLFFEKDKNIHSEISRLTNVSIQRILPEKYTEETIKRTNQTKGVFILKRIRVTKSNKSVRQRVVRNTPKSGQGLVVRKAGSENGPKRSDGKCWSRRSRYGKNPLPVRYG